MKPLKITESETSAQQSNNRPAWLRGPIAKADFKGRIRLVSGFLASQVARCFSVYTYYPVGFVPKLETYVPRKRGGVKEKKGNHGRTFCRDQFKRIPLLKKSSVRVCPTCELKIRGRNHNNGTHHKLRKNKKGV